MDGSLRLSGLGMRYGRRTPWVFRGIEVTLEAGQIVTLTGPNGSGKTTLLAVAAGLLRPSEGEVIGRPLSVGYSPERIPILRFSPLEYFEHMGRIKGLSRVQRGPQIERIVTALSLGGFVRTDARSLSKGTIQKMLVGQALLGRPGLLVLDEPGASLDPPSRTGLSELLAEAARDATVLLSEQEGARLPLPAGPSWKLSDGRLLQDRRAAFVPRKGRVLIEAHADGSVRLPDLTTRSIRRSGSSLHLEVDADAADVTLARLLQAGISIRRVESVDEAEETEERSPP